MVVQQAQLSRPGGPLWGREAELWLLDGVVGALRAGGDAALVLVGEAGSGKTRLLDEVAARSAGMSLLQAAGVESEAGLSHGALHQMLAPVLHRADALPPPLRDALRATFGLMAGPPADRLLLGLAVLALLAEAAAGRPLVCLVDDAQWWDRGSLEALGVAGRRLGAGVLGLVVAVSDEEGVPAALEGLPAHRLDGLSAAAARTLLTDAVTGPPSESALTRILADTGGNALALTELAACLTPAQLACASALPAHLPLGRRLEARVLRRVGVLPVATRSLLLLASALPSADPALLWHAADLLGLSPEVADPALANGVLSLSPDVAFHPPLLRSAVYAGAPPEDRRRVHGIIAAALDDAEQDGRAWQRGAAAVGLDEQVAAELAEAAEHVRSRHGHPAEAEFLARAAELTGDAGTRAGRLLATAQARLLSGDAGASQVLLAQARAASADPTVRLRVRHLDGAIRRSTAHVPAVPEMLLKAVAAGPPDARITRDILFEAMTAAVVAGRRIIGVGLDDVARAVRAAPPQPEGTPTALDLLLEGLAARVTEGYAVGAPLLRRALAELCSSPAVARAGSSLPVLVCKAADDLWDEDGRRRLLDRLQQVERTQGALTALHITLLGQATARLRAGRFAEAEAFHDESATVSAAIGFPPEGPVNRLDLLAWQGREAEARAAAKLAVREWGEERGMGAMMELAALALGVLDLSLGRYHDALSLLRGVFEHDAPAYGNLALADLVEAAVRAGDRAVAADALQRLAERAPVSGTPWALGLLARSRALLTRGDAERDHRESIDQLARSSVTTELARSQLLYGEWLRRRSRRIDAREQLRVAHTAFDAMGAEGFAERARLELLATGERARPRRAASATPMLTPQEARIAGLAAQGETNAEIAARLFVTGSTVEYHLSKVFRKLSVTSRRHLADALRDQRVLGHEPRP